MNYEINDDGTKITIKTDGIEMSVGGPQIVLHKDKVNISKNHSSRYTSKVNGTISYNEDEETWKLRKRGGFNAEISADIIETLLTRAARSGAINEYRSTADEFVKDNGICDGLRLNQYTVERIRRKTTTMYARDEDDALDIAKRRGRGYWDGNGEDYEVISDE